MAILTKDEAKEKIGEKWQKDITKDFGDEKVVKSNGKKFIVSNELVNTIEQCRKMTGELSLDDVSECIMIDAKKLSDKVDIDLQGKMSELTGNVCRDYNDIREWVMEKAWNLVNKKKWKFEDAVEESWDKAKKKCLMEGEAI